MRRLAFVIAGFGAAVASFVVACNHAPTDEDLAGSESAIEAVDPLEGAYTKQGGAPSVHEKLKSWCGSAGDSDCDPAVQSTTLECGAKGLVCTTKHQCVCGE